MYVTLDNLFVEVPKIIQDYDTNIFIMINEEWKNLLEHQFPKYILEEKNRKDSPLMFVPRSFYLRTPLQSIRRGQITTGAKMGSEF